VEENKEKNIQRPKLQALNVTTTNSATRGNRGKLETQRKDKKAIRKEKGKRTKKAKRNFLVKREKCV